MDDLDFLQLLQQLAAHLCFPNVCAVLPCCSGFHWSSQRFIISSLRNICHFPDAQSVQRFLLWDGCLCLRSFPYTSAISLPILRVMESLDWCFWVSSGFRSASASFWPEHGFHTFFMLVSGTFMNNSFGFYPNIWYYGTNQEWQSVTSPVSAQSLSHVPLFEDLQILAHQASLSMEFSSKNTGVSCRSLLQGIFPTCISWVSCIGKQILYH